jgi:F-type H+-transporting ATPase subunit b
MLIDWFTVVAQGLNFLVLVWLLKRYLYMPVLSAIDAREKHIALTIADAESQKKAAEQERVTFETKKAALDGEGAALLKQAVTAADAERARLLADARVEADSLREKQMTALRDDLTRLREGIANRVQKEVLAIARRALTDLTGASLEERMVVVFVQHLRALDASAKKTLAVAFGGACDAVVRSGFELAEAQRALIQNAVNQEFAASTALRFDVSADMPCGVELLVGGQKLSWSIADYLDGLEQRVAPVSQGERIPSPAIRPATAVAVSTP